MYPLDINLIYSLNHNRTVNLLRIALSYYKHSLLKDYSINGFPPAISIEPTNLCNLHCLQCPTGREELKRKKGEMEPSLFKEIIDDLKDHVIYLLLYFQGEPFLNKNINSMIKYARENNIYVTVNTNGHFIKTDSDAENIINSRLNAIIFSVDGAAEDTYKLYRSGGDFSTVINGIKRLTETKQKIKSKSPKVYLQFIVMKHNQSEIEQIKSLGKSLNVDRIFLKSAQIYGENDYNNLSPSIDKYKRYEKLNGKLILNKKLKNRCKRILFTSVITWDGQVLPCCFDKDANFSFGNIKDKNFFKNIWNSEKSTDFRKRVFTKRDSVSICRNCTE